ncbi:MAG TPA: Fe-S cluster protein [Nitrospiraceae bacterium]|nr:Fe-S cluster protein [Nitrospiraceae bacterium]
MLLKGYRKEIFDPTCNPNFQSVHCIAHLNEDIGEALPYLNAALEGDTYINNPPSVTFKVHGKLITVHAGKIAINALRDEQEAQNILEWLKKEINEAWENREQITPKYDGITKPHILEIYKLLPKTNCRECGQPTCMVFASQAADGIKDSEDCPPLSTQGREILRDYLHGYRL